MYSLLLPGNRLRTFYILVMFSYLPPFLWQLISGNGIYQHGYHILLVLLASGVATGAAVVSPRLSFFLFASMLLNVIILALDAVGVRLAMGISLAGLTLLVLCLIFYYGVWALIIVRRWRKK
ncbi:MAG TPA: hypothetical protein VKY35_06320 [Aliidiomarina sp.]|nr:hypothetical protein [Aliidiomarina sp.]